MAGIEPPIPATAANTFAPAVSISRPPSAQSTKSSASVAAGGITALGKWRRTVGLTLLALVIVTWTATNFLASAILADHSFDHPFFVTYVNTLFFIIPLPPALIHKAYRHPEEFRQWKGECRAGLGNVSHWLHRRRDSKYRRDSSHGDSRTSLLPNHISSTPSPKPNHTSPKPLSLASTARLSLEFCLLWFFAGFFLLVCLEYTTVASSTILTSTASGFTLIFGALTGVERFTPRKLLSVLLSLTGIVLISTVDLSGKSADDDHRGDFPEKTLRELAVGNILALVSAAIYAVYIVRMKGRIPDERAISMPVFFGFVGLANAALLWPGFFILHWTGLEPFSWPEPGRVTAILLTNAAGSMVSDIAWAYAVLLTSPILVTVGLSMTIPLTLVGQMVVNSQTSTFLYWVGAAVVAASFVIVNMDERQEEESMQVLDERDFAR